MTTGAAISATAHEGFTLSHVQGNVPDTQAFWDHEDPAINVLATDYGAGKGWKMGTVHRYELDYRSDRVIISIDGDVIFDIAGSFTAGEFGIYNYDVYGRWEDPIFASATFQLEADGDWSKVDYVYLVTDDGRISVRYPRSDWERFSFDRQRQNLLIGITSDARIVMVAPDNFVTQAAGLASSDRSQEWNCRLEGDGIKIQDPADLQELIDGYFAS